MQKENKNITFFDSSFGTQEQLPRHFKAVFRDAGNNKDQVRLNDVQVGDVVNDNSNEPDYYRYHDIFHYTFATMLGWSPCVRSMMKRKRKSNPLVDEIEDGARATITEEAISLILFSEAKRKDMYKRKRHVSKTTLRIIKEMTEPFEVRSRTEAEWAKAIKKGYELFRILVKNGGGEIHFDMEQKKMEYSNLT
jgi:hypothetical protein